MEPDTTTSPDPLDAVDTALTAPTTESVLVEQELLVEEISIDGMCGVY